VKSVGIKDELKDLVGKKCWLKGNTLEIRKRSDAEIIDVEDDNVVIEHFTGTITRIPISGIWTIQRKDLLD